MAGLRIYLDLDTSQAEQKADRLMGKITGKGASFLSGITNPNFIKNNPELAAILGVGGPRGAAYASAGTGEFPLPKFVSKFGASARQMRQALSELNPALKEYKRDLAGALKGMQWNFPSGGPPPIPSGMLSDKALAAGVQRSLGMGALFPKATDWRTAAIGAGGSMFSPWIGARLLNQAFGGFPGLGGGGGKAGGGMTSALFGGGPAGFGEWYLFINALRMASKVLRDEFVEAVRRGAQLYLKAAGLGTSTENLSRLQKTFSMLGLPASSVEKLLAYGQFGRGMRMSSAQLSGQILGLGGQGVLSREEMQAILNLSDDVAAAWNMSLDAARQTAEVSGHLFKVSFLGSQLKSEWQTFWEQFTDIFSGAISAVEKSLIFWGHILNAFIETIKKNATKLAVISPGIFGPIAAAMALNKIEFGTKTKENARLGLGYGVSRPESGWERMGLIISGGLGGTDYAKQTAENTKKIADSMTKLFNPKDIMQSFASLNNSVLNYNHP